MPPAPHRHSSFSDDSDRYSNGDLASADGADGYGKPPVAPAHFPPPPRRTQHQIQVPRSTRKEIESSRVGRVAESLPGFSDWRGSGGGGDQLGESGRSGGGGGGGGGRSVKSSHSSRRKKSSHRSSARRSHSSSFRSSQGSSYSAGSSVDKNIRDIESDVMAQVTPSPSSRSRARRPPKRYNSQNSDDANESLPSMPSVVSYATEETDKFSNTTTATMLKYKKLYETMLRDANERGAGDASWVGLGDIREEQSTRSGSVKTSASGNSGSAKSEHNARVATKGSPCGSGIDDSGRSSDGGGGAPWIHRAPPRRGPSFLSEVGPPARRTSGTSFHSAPVLLDSVISGLQVEEVLLEPGAPDARAGDAAGRDERALVPVDGGGAGIVVVREDEASQEQDDASYEPVEIKTKSSRSRKKRGERGDKAGHNDFNESSFVLLPDEDAGADDEEVGSSYQHKDVSYGSDLASAVEMVNSGIIVPTAAKGRDHTSESSRSKKKGGDRGDRSGAHRSGRHGRSNDSLGGSRGAKKPERGRREKHYPPSRADHSPSADKHKGGRGGDGGRNGRSRDRSRSPSVSPSVGSQRSGRSNRSGRSSRSNRSVGSRLSNLAVPRIISRSISRGRSGSRSRARSGSRPRARSRGGRNVHADDDSELQTKATAASTDDSSNAAGRPKKGFFRRVKKLAGTVKKSLGVTGLHKFRVGERARYRVIKVPRSLEGYDAETRTVEAEIVLVHIDAVLDTPYYTIRLPDGARKQTNWDKLIPLHEWEKMKAEGDSHGYREDPHPEPASRNRSVSRGGGAGRERSSSRDGRRRSYVQVDDDDRSARSGTSHRSARSGASRRSERLEPPRRPSSSQGHSRDDGRRRDRDRRTGRDRSSSKGRSSRGEDGRPGVDRRPSGRSRRH